MLVLPFLVASPARSDYKPPPKKSVPAGPTTFTGRRDGCQPDQATALTALAPQTHVGQSMATHPVFTWYVPEHSVVPLEFHLYQWANNQKIEIFRTVRQSQPGFMVQQLPTTAPALVVGERYLWQVVAICNPDRPSTALIVNAELEIVAPPPSLVLQLSKQPDPFGRAKILAENGLWYDAMRELSHAPVSTRRSELRLMLLRQLASLEATENHLTQSTRLHNLIAEESQKISYSQFPIKTNGAQ